VPDQAQTRFPGALGDEARGGFELPDGIDGDQQGTGGIGWSRHLRIPVRAAKPLEVERPNIETGLHERVAPGAVREPVRDGQRGRKRRAVDVEHRPRYALRRRQPPQEQGQPGVRTVDAVMLLARVKTIDNHRQLPFPSAPLSRTVRRRGGE